MPSSDFIPDFINAQVRQFAALAPSFNKEFSMMSQQFFVYNGQTE